MGKHGIIQFNKFRIRNLDSVCHKFICLEQSTLYLQSSLTLYLKKLDYIIVKCFCTSQIR